LAVQATSILTLVLALLLPPVITTTAATPWVMYTAPRLGFSIGFPTSWAPTVARGFVFAVIGPAAADLPTIRLNVTVAVAELPSGTTPDVFDTQTEEMMQANVKVNEYRVLQIERVTVGTLPAMFRVYTWKRKEGLGLHVQQLVVVRGTRGYVVTGTTGAASSQLDDEVSLLKSILMTFQFQ
jgi:hypothetical protein